MPAFGVKAGIVWNSAADEAASLFGALYFFGGCCAPVIAAIPASF